MLTVFGEGEGRQKEADVEGMTMWFAVVIMW